MIKKRIIILIVLIAALLATYVGITYATFTSSAIQTNENIITTTDCLNITFQRVNSPLNLTNSYPMKDEVAQNKTPYTFTITNGCSHYLTVDLGFEIASTSTLTSSQVKATISRTGTLSMPDLLSNRSSAAPIREGEEARTLYTDDLLPNESKTYDFRMWLNYDEIATNVVGKGMTGTIIVVGTIKTNNTLRGTLMSNTNNFLTGNAQSVYTTPGREIATDFEGLRTTPDDYGTSYYYRGSVENNYVVFANMCWRIVRIDGLGNSKLVLYNYNANNVTNPCATSEDGDTNAFARHGGTYISQFNENSNNNIYVGFMHSNNPSSTDFETAHANEKDSTILTFLKNWYDDVFTSSQTEKLADVIWCNDKSLITDPQYDPGQNGISNPTGTGMDFNYYGPAYRLYPSTSASPSLICWNNGSDSKLSKFTSSDTINGNGKLKGVNGVGANEYKIGLLTADEIAFAGVIYYDFNDDNVPGNSEYYLYKNAKKAWWTLSPFWYEDMSYVMINDIYQSSSIITLGSGVDDNFTAVRPAISLKNTTTIVKGGAGTQANPFVINENN